MYSFNYAHIGYIIIEIYVELSDLWHHPNIIYLFKVNN